eukprot:GSChrysophyteH1.ASY1.ANO1.1617.1 assembled CDS
MKTTTYFALSFAAVVALCVYALYSREQFYPVVLFLVTSKISYVVGGNMVFATALLLASMIQSIFLGPLRNNEMEMLADRAKFTIVETCLALTIFRNELTPPIIALFGGLLFLNAFHWLAKSRIDLLDQIMSSALVHVRLMALLIVLAVVDATLAYEAIEYTLKNGKSVMILFSFEFGLCVINCLNMISRYIVTAFDGYVDGGLNNKGLYYMLVDLLCDAMRFVTYLFFFSLVFVYYGMPIYLVRELWNSFYVLQKNVGFFYRYLRLTSNLDARFESATEEELRDYGVCPVCHEPMSEGKKLPCNHIFHISCLRTWLQHKQECPMCRRGLPVNAPLNHRRRRQEAAERRANENQAAAGEVLPAQQPALNPRRNDDDSNRRTAMPSAESRAARRRRDFQNALRENAIDAQRAIPGTPDQPGDALAADTPQSGGERQQSTPASEGSYHAHRAHDRPHDRVHEQFIRDGRARSRSPSMSPGNTSLSSASPISRMGLTDEVNQVLPAFFTIQSEACVVHKNSNAASGVVRTLMKGTVVFVFELYDDAGSGTRWARLPDGWVWYDDLGGDASPSLAVCSPGASSLMGPPASPLTPPTPRVDIPISADNRGSFTRTPPSTNSYIPGIAFTGGSHASAASNRSTDSTRVEQMINMQERLRYLVDGVSEMQKEVQTVSLDLQALVEEEIKAEEVAVSERAAAERQKQTELERIKSLEEELRKRDASDGADMQNAKNIPGSLKDSKTLEAELALMCLKKADAKSKLRAWSAKWEKDHGRIPTIEDKLSVFNDEDGMLWKRYSVYKECTLHLRDELIKATNREQKQSQPNAESNEKAGNEADNSPKSTVFSQETEEQRMQEDKKRIYRRRVGSGAHQIGTSDEIDRPVEAADLASEIYHHDLESEFETGESTENTPRIDYPSSTENTPRIDYPSSTENTPRIDYLPGIAEAPPSDKARHDIDRVGDGEEEEEQRQNGAEEGSIPPPPTADTTPQMPVWAQGYVSDEGENETGEETNTPLTPRKSSGSASLAELREIRARKFAASAKAVESQSDGSPRES